MKISENPIARREWARFMRHWPAWIGVLIALVFLGFLRSYGLGNLFGVMGPGGMRIWLISMTHAILPRMIDFFVVFWIAHSLERERQGCWEHLAVTRLTPRDIVVGKIAALFVMAFVYGFIIQGHYLYMMFQHFSRFGESFSGRAAKILICIQFPLGILEGLSRTAMTGFLAFRLCRRRTFGHGLISTLGSLLLIDIGLQVLVFSPVGLMRVAINSRVGFQNIPYLYLSSAAQNVMSVLLFLALQLELARRFLLLAERDMASDPALSGDH